MKVGDVFPFELTRLVTVKTTCSQVGAVLGRKFSTHVNKQNSTIEVTRVQ